MRKLTASISIFVFKGLDFTRCAFRCVLFTVMRVLGIPARVVTVFNAAHDTDTSLAIEEYYTTRGQKLGLSKDSVWLVLIVHLSHSQFKNTQCPGHEPFVMSPQVRCGLLRNIV